MIRIMCAIYNGLLYIRFVSGATFPCLCASNLAILYSRLSFNSVPFMLTKNTRLSTLNMAQRKYPQMLVCFVLGFESWALYLANIVIFITHIMLHIFDKQATLVLVPGNNIDKIYQINYQMCDVIKSRHMLKVFLQ